MHSKYLTIDDLLRSKEKTKKIIQSAFIKAGKKLLASSINVDLSGCTCNMILLTSFIIYCANIGDSRSILINKEEDKFTSEVLSIDNKPSTEAEAKRIIENGGEIDSIRGVYIKYRL